MELRNKFAGMNSWMYETMKVGVIVLIERNQVWEECELPEN